MPLGTGMSSCCCGCKVLFSDTFRPAPPLEPENPEEESSSFSANLGPWPLSDKWETDTWQIDHPLTVWGVPVMAEYSALVSASGRLSCLRPLDYAAYPNVYFEIDGTLWFNSIAGTKLRWYFAGETPATGYYVEGEFTASSQTWTLYDPDGIAVRPGVTFSAGGTSVYSSPMAFQISICLWQDTSEVVESEESSVSDEAAHQPAVTVSIGWNPFAPYGWSYGVLGTLPVSALGQYHGLEATLSGGTKLYVDDYKVTLSGTSKCPACYRDCPTCISDDPPLVLKAQFSGMQPGDYMPLYTVPSACECINVTPEWYSYKGNCTWLASRYDRCLGVTWIHFTKEPLEGEEDQWTLWLERGSISGSQPGPGRWKSGPLGPVSQKLDCQTFDGVLLTHFGDSPEFAGTTVTITATTETIPDYALICGCSETEYADEVEVTVSGLGAAPGATCPCPYDGYNGTYILQSLGSGRYQYVGEDFSVSARLFLSGPSWSITAIEVTIGTVTASGGVPWPNCDGGTVHYYARLGPTSECCCEGVFVPEGLGGWCNIHGIINVRALW